MAKHENNAVIVLLSAVIGILLVVIAFFLLRLLTVDKQLIHHKVEVDRAIVLLREERERLKAARDAEKDERN